MVYEFEFVAMIVPVFCAAPLMIHSKFQEVSVPPGVQLIVAELSNMLETVNAVGTGQENKVLK